ncbi:hypothetical protein [Actinomadura napierensis]|uniref:Uncharacterized protein n=1 Tax=Actinomadura napierensis TaxID=267854 RepID=A0ABN2Y868_9ACTN
MKIRLAGGVVASDMGAWTAGPSGAPARVAGGAVAQPGAPVALGPAGASGADVRHAVEELSALVEAGGVVAAGAGADLGAGFRSARLEGARGDQRDAVLAALRALGLEHADRLGDRTRFLVALFGPSVTRRVGAAAAKAAGDGRWAALRLASAASDVLGPEQLERVLDLDGPDTAVPGAPSVLGGYLRRVLDGVPRPRRLDLLLDLWSEVLGHQERLGRRDRRLATQSRRDRLADLRERRVRHEDEVVVGWLKGELGHEPSLADAARWTPPDAYWRDQLVRMFQDAIAATALLRTAVAVADHGFEEGLARSAALLGAVIERCPAWTGGRGRSGGLPARPTVPVGEIHRRLSAGKPVDARLIGFVKPRLTRAKEYGILVIETVEAVMDRMIGHQDDPLRDWGAHDLRGWRAASGYSAVRPLAGWGGIPPWTGPILGDREPLREREELVGDLLWYVDLIDALAQLHGHDAARSVDGTGAPWFDYDPPPLEEPEPLTPRLDSVTLAVSGAAQLVALGGVPPKGVRTWTGFTEGLTAGTAISEALTGEFKVPPALAAREGAAVPGAKVRVRVARSARDLAEWSDHMGNCIASPWYVDDAREGRVALVGLYDQDGVLVANAEVSPRRPQSRGWHVTEIAARFNGAPDTELERRFRAWVDAIPGTRPPEEPVPEEVPPVRTPRRRPAPRLVEEVGPALGDLARAAWDGTRPGTLEVFAALAATPPDAALTRLRRLGSAQLTAAVRRALGTGSVTLAGLWGATGERPLAAALEGLDPALRQRYDQLPLLLGEPPLPKTLRRLVRLPAIADPYALDLVARRVRAAVGRLAVQDDPAVARAVAHRPTEPLLCALAVLVTCAAPDVPLATVVPPREIAVPGYPATTLEDEDGPWRRALPDAAELGADTGLFWDEVAEHGLRVPASWLGAGGWTALWSRAHSHR